MAHTVLFSWKLVIVDERLLIFITLMDENETLCNSFRTPAFILNLQRPVKTTAIIALYYIKLHCDPHKI